MKTLRILRMSQASRYKEEASQTKQTELAKTLERIEAITKPADSGLFFALVNYEKEQSSLLDEV